MLDSIATALVLTVVGFCALIIFILARLAVMGNRIKELERKFTNERAADDGGI